MKLNGSALVFLVIIILILVLFFKRGERLRVEGDIGQPEIAYIPHEVQNTGGAEDVYDAPSSQYLHYYPDLDYTRRDYEESAYIPHEVQNSFRKDTSDPSQFFHYGPHLSGAVTEDEEPAYIPHEIQNAPEQNDYYNPSQFFHYYPHLSY